MTVEPFYKAPARGQFLLNGFSRPHDDDGELRKSIIVIAQAIENAKKENERVISERELLEALDAIDELAKRGP